MVNAHHVFLHKCQQEKCH